MPMRRLAPGPCKRKNPEACLDQEQTGADAVALASQWRRALPKYIPQAWIPGEESPFEDRSQGLRALYALAAERRRAAAYIMFCAA